MKLFVVSDIHGFYDEFRKALDDAGFDPANPEHLAIGLGDYLDRGSQPEEVINYLVGLPNKVLVKGNHSDLFEEFCKRGYPLGHDWSNGTANSILDLAPESKNWESACLIAMNKMKPLLDQMVNYYETRNYIFVHSFVPLNVLDDMPKHYTRGRVYEKMENWREAHNSDWEVARWGNPFQLAKDGFLPDKCLVFGHFHTSWPRHHWAWSDEAEPEWGEGADFSPYYGNGFIGIDACTAYSGKVNVLVLEDELIDN